MREEGQRWDHSERRRHMRVISFEKWEARNYIAEVRNDHDAKLQVHETLEKKHTSKKHIR